MKEPRMPLIRPDGRSLITPVLHFYWRIARGMTLGVRGCVVDEAGRLLLIRHSYTPGWHFPGGGVEVGQTLEEALAMELREEANVEMTGSPALRASAIAWKVALRDGSIARLVPVTTRAPKSPYRIPVTFCMVNAKSAAPLR